MRAFPLRSLLPCALAALAALPAGHDTRAAAVEVVLTGTIEGTVRIPGTPARRTAERYAAALPAPERTLQHVPPVVYLKGTLPPIRASGRARLSQRDTLFQPAALAVTTGTTVEFPNGDSFFHNVFSYSRARRFDLGRYPRGESKSVLFDEPGVVKVYCEVHQSMRALVVVLDHEYHAVVGDDGRFTIADVPPGRYELVVEDIDRGTRTVAVTVQSGVTVRPSVSF